MVVHGVWRMAALLMLLLPVGWWWGLVTMVPVTGFTTSSTLPSRRRRLLGASSWSLTWSSTSTGITQRRPRPRPPLFHASSTTTTTSEPNVSHNNNSNNSNNSNGNTLEPQVLATGYSQAMELTTALHEAVDMALESLPPQSQSQQSHPMDLALVFVSSLYDNTANPSHVVPTILERIPGIAHVLGCTVGGFVSTLMANNNNHINLAAAAARPLEREGVPGVSVVLARLPHVQLQTFHVVGDQVPKDYRKCSSQDFQDCLGVSDWKQNSNNDNNDNNDNNNNNDNNDKEEDETIALVLPSPAFQAHLDDLIQGMEVHFSGSTPATIVGAIASTVSSLSRARLFRYSRDEQSTTPTALADGCVGILFKGDIQVQTLMAQGAKPVGGVYQIVQGQESTISTIALDEAATERVRAVEEQQQQQQMEDDNDDDNDDNDNDVDTNTRQRAKAQLQQAYAKARIPKPVLAEANFLMKTLSDDDQAFMKKTLLVGLERPNTHTGAAAGGIGQSPSELVRLAQGQGPGYTVHQVASAAMNDGSVTLSLGSVDIQPGQRLRFYVRESDYAKQEIQALWNGYQRRVGKDPDKDESDKDNNDDNSDDNSDDNEKSVSTFTPTGCLLFPTLDRGSKFFFGKSGYESQTALESLPTLPCIAGFFGNGVIGSLDPNTAGRRERTRVLGSASAYILFGSKSNRPIYVPGRAAAETAKTQDEKEAQEAEEKRLDEEAKTTEKRVKSLEMMQEKAPRDEHGELILRRREVHSGRAMTVSTVEWSVAEKSASPTSALEQYMWDKEAEVDRFRERVPLSNLVSQWRLSMVDTTKPKPRDWIGPVKEAAAGGSFVIIPECKRMEPGIGSLRKRYDVMKLTKEFTLAGVPAIGVNCDGIFFGGSLEDVTQAREGTAKAAMGNSKVVVPPILASDLVLYPYQLYKIRLAGADAVNLMAAALESKDLIYLTKIAASLQMQTFVTVTSARQIETIEALPAGSVTGLVVSNRNLEDFSFDMTGRQVLDVLSSDAMKRFRDKNGDDIAVLADGRVGIVTGQETGGSPQEYIRDLQKAGAMGAVVGAALVPDENRKSPLELLLQTSST